MRWFKTVFSKDNLGLLAQLFEDNHEFFTQSTWISKMSIIFFSSLLENDHGQKPLVYLKIIMAQSTQIWSWSFVPVYPKMIMVFWPSLSEDDHGLLTQSTRRWSWSFDKVYSKMIIVLWHSLLEDDHGHPWSSKFWSLVHVVHIHNPKSAAG